MKAADRLSVVVFSGGRGSSVLSENLIKRPDVQLTLAINGYDDGLSTGEVRRFLGDSLGPSDFRKNASHLAKQLHSCPRELIDLLDVRLPAPASLDDARTRISGTAAAGREAISDRLAFFEREIVTRPRPFQFADCSIGNLVFAGCFLRAEHNFNLAVDDYCALLGLPPGLVENVSDGTDAYLVAVDLTGQLISSEADMVDAKRRNHIKDIYLLARPLTPGEQQAIGNLPVNEMGEALHRLSRPIPANPRLLARVAEADLIVYSPGTQHSSLFPSYLTEGLSAAIAGNLTAIKLLVTNIQTDAEIADSTAVEIIESAAFYLREKGRSSVPVPCLITHYVINDPRQSDVTPYVPLGRLDSIEDPRLVRIGNYEDGISGRHDAAKVLGPFIESLLPHHRQRIAVWLYDASTANKVIQTMLEMVRAGIEQIPVAVTVFYGGVPELDEALVARLPFAVRHVHAGDRTLPQGIDQAHYDYVILFESSGMYNGEDVVSLAAHLTSGRLDAVWGSRRLSVTDIQASLRLQYRHHTWRRIASLAGSHALSAAYLVLYGRYVSDTLSGARGLRVRYCENDAVSVGDRLLNQRLLSRLLAARAEMLETPVQFYPMSPAQVRRTTVMDGLRSLTLIASRKWRAMRGQRV
jgi:2-phospho-L-lactate transferase/gluconeogenesis factor (CofD/UPF0052 family)